MHSRFPIGFIVIIAMVASLALVTRSMTHIPIFRSATSLLRRSITQISSSHGSLPVLSTAHGTTLKASDQPLSNVN